MTGRPTSPSSAGIGVRFASQPRRPPVGGARAASKFGGAAADVSQQRSRERSERRRLAGPAGGGGGVTAAAWGAPCDTITTTLCWCRGSLCLGRIPTPARASHRPALVGSSRPPRPPFPRCEPAAGARRRRARGFGTRRRVGICASLPPAAEEAAALKLVRRSGPRLRVPARGWGCRGVGVGVGKPLRFHEILRSVARRRRRRRRFR